MKRWISLFFFFYIGTCQCLNGYIRNVNGDCMSLESVDDIPLHSPMSKLLTEQILENTSNNKSIPVTRKPLAVKAESKKVRLPENEATLYADVEPAGDKQKYQFDWTTLHQPDGSTAVQHKNEGKLHLEKLTEGIYAFKVGIMLLVSTSFCKTSTIKQKERVCETFDSKTFKCCFMFTEHNINVHKTRSTTQKTAIYCSVKKLVICSTQGFFFFQFVYFIYLILTSNYR